MVRIEAVDITDRQISVRARVADGPPSGLLAGTAPRIRFWEEQVTLISTTPDALVKWFGYFTGDAVTKGARRRSG